MPAIVNAIYPQVSDYESRPTIHQRKAHALQHQYITQ